MKSIYIFSTPTISFQLHLTFTVFSFISLRPLRSNSSRHCAISRFIRTADCSIYNIINKKVLVVIVRRHSRYAKLIHERHALEYDKKKINFVHRVKKIKEKKVDQATVIQQRGILFCTKCSPRSFLYIIYKFSLKKFRRPVVHLLG